MTSASAFPITVVAAAVMALAGAGIAAVMPTSDEQVVAAPALDQLLPDEFGQWSAISLSDVVLPPESDLGPGEAVSYKAYTDDLGRVVTLVVAYGPPLGDSVRLHRPEACYTAQGFSIDTRAVSAIATGDRTIPTVQLATARSTLREAVTYWLREGKVFTTAAPQSQLVSLLKPSSTRRDGVLVRVSTRQGVDPLFDLHAVFLKDLAGALSPDGKRLLLGSEGRTS